LVATFKSERKASDAFSSLQSVAGAQCHLRVGIVEQSQEKVFQRGVFVPLRGGEGQGGL